LIIVECKCLNKNQLENEYNSYKQKGKTLDMSRGKPSPSQLDNLWGMLTEITKSEDCYSENGTDCRNYGCPDGIPEAKRLFADILEMKSDNIIVCGNSSLNLMYDTISMGYLFGVNGCTPWGRQEKIKFLCPVPGYDRHFAITKLFGFEHINIPMTEEGPDMDRVRQYAENDETVKGIWCVPKYSNPTGITFSDRVVREFASLKPAAKDFAVMWDNAYAVHGFTETPDKLLPVMAEAEKKGNEDLFYIFTSTSKITYSGGGISCIALSEKNKQVYLKLMGIRTIGYDKLNMLRHARFLSKHLEEVMEKHGRAVREKFELCYKYFEVLEREVEGFGFSRPNGGYFINVNVPAGKAKQVVSLAREAGLILTPAGATFPGGVDPEDRNIRIAPTYPTAGELEEALKLFSICVKLAVSR
jgi:DNA-binding transcriptional MocR family regulator